MNKAEFLINLWNFIPLFFYLRISPDPPPPFPSFFLGQPPPPFKAIYFRVPPPNPTSPPYPLKNERSLKTSQLLYVWFRLIQAKLQACSYQEVGISRKATFASSSRVPFFVKRDWDYFFSHVKRDLGFFIYSWFVIAHIWFLREREQILGITRDAWTASIFLRECILQSGIGDPHLPSSYSKTLE